MLSVTCTYACNALKALTSYKAAKSHDYTLFLTNRFIINPFFTSFVYILHEFIKYPPLHHVLFHYSTNFLVWPSLQVLHISKPKLSLYKQVFLAGDSQSWKFRARTHRLARTELLFIFQPIRPDLPTNPSYPDRETASRFSCADKPSARTRLTRLSEDKELESTRFVGASCMLSKYWKFLELFENLLIIKLDLILKGLEKGTPRYRWASFEAQTACNGVWCMPSQKSTMYVLTSFHIFNSNPHAKHDRFNEHRGICLKTRFTFLSPVHILSSNHILSNEGNKYHPHPYYTMSKQS